MGLPITTPKIIEHLTGLKNGFDFSCSHIDSTRKADGTLNNTDVYISAWTSDVTQPTDEEILAAQEEVEALIKSQEYIEKRKAEYPSIEELVVALYDTDDKSAVEAKRAEVKLKFPKP